MKTVGPDFISGWKTAADWVAARQALVVGQPGGWDAAYADFYRERLKLRYFEPIELLQANGGMRGEGFSIVAIQCSLIEFLESTAQGINYRYVRGRQQPGGFEYSSSREIFVSFLTKRPPFDATFNAAAADDFYASVRCGLLHEARTKNSWRIWADGPAVADTQQKIVFRNSFQDALLTYLAGYAQRLPQDASLQEAFIRKLDYLCHGA
jgi:hypothetical protein